MKILNIRGREVNINPRRYLIDWDRAVSKPQKAVKDFLRPFWEGGYCLEEFRIPGSLLRVDLLNVSRGMVVEVSPKRSHAYNAFFHGSLAGYREALKRELDKQGWAESAGFQYIEITDDDFPLTVPRFLEQFKTLPY